MTHSDEHVARLEAQADAAATERRQLRSIIAELRGVLGTPEGTSVVQHARDVVAEAQRAREDLAQAQSWIAMLEPDMAQALDKMRAAQTDADKWRAVPWDVIGRTVYPVRWTPEDDDVFDLRTWYDRSKPEEVGT